MVVLVAALVVWLVQWSLLFLWVRGRQRRGASFSQDEAARSQWWLAGLSLPAATAAVACAVETSIAAGIILAVPLLAASVVLRKQADPLMPPRPPMHSPPGEF